MISSRGETLMAKISEDMDASARGGVLGGVLILLNCGHGIVDCLCRLAWLVLDVVVRSIGWCETSSPHVSR